MSLTVIITFLLTFFVAYATSHYTVSTWGVKQPVAIVVGALFGVLAAVFATLAVSALVTV